MYSGKSRAKAYVQWQITVMGICTVANRGHGHMYSGKSRCGNMYSGKSLRQAYVQWQITVTGMHAQHLENHG
jgi:hypothetical protein